jgi:DNA-binding SARP family transcriptional activator
MPCVSSPTDMIDTPMWDDGLEPRPSTIAVRAHLLGAFRMTVDGCGVRWASVRSRSVVEHLVLAGRPVARDVLMDRLWPRFDAERARNNLNVALAGARRALYDADRRIIVHTHGAYGFGPTVALWVDVVAFERHVQLGHLLDREGDRVGAVREYLAAIDLYRGDLLAEEVYADGLEGERAFYRRAYSEVLKRLTERWLEQGQLREASWTCQLGLRHDDLDEEFVALWVRCLSRRGQRARVVKDFEQFRTRAQREMGADPSPALRELVHELTHRTA